MKNRIVEVFVISLFLIFFLNGCANLPLIGKKRSEEKLPEGKTVRVEGLETIKGVNPQIAETPPPSKPSPPPPIRKEPDSKIASIPSRPFYGSPLPYFQMGLKKKVIILDFENKTTYKEEKIGETVAKRLSDKLEASQRVVLIDRNAILEMLRREGLSFESLSNLEFIKRAHRSYGIQAILYGSVMDVSLLSSKTSEASEEEVSFATAKVEVRLVDASTGNLLKTFIGRSPIFGTKETGEYSRSKAVTKAIDFALEDTLDGLLRYLDYLEWSTTIAKIEGETLFLNAGKLSGLRVGDHLEVYEPGKEIIHPTTHLSLGWTTGRLKGLVRVQELFGVDAAIAKRVEGNDFSPGDIVKSTFK